MTKHGISHGAATLVTPVIAGLMVSELRRLLPGVGRFLEKFSKGIIYLFELPPSFTVEVVSAILIASALAVVWGMLFAAGTGQGSKPPAGTWQPGERTR